MISQNQKRIILEREFSELNLNPSDKLTQQQFEECLDKKSGNKFDREVFSQLFDRVDKDYNLKASVSDFIDITLEAEEILKSKIQNSKNNLEEFHRYRRETNTKLMEQQSEQLNQYGIMPDSKLQIDLIQVTYPNLINNNQLNAQFQCGQNVYESQVVQYNGESFVFNEHIEFQITSGLEDLAIGINIIDQQYNTQSIGQLTVPLNRLKDQHKHEEALDIYDVNGHISQGKIYLRLEWIYSRVKFLKDLIKKYDGDISSANEDLIDYEQDLSQIYLPFPNLLKAYKDNIPGFQASPSASRNAQGLQASPYRDSQRSQYQEYDKAEVKAVKMSSVLAPNNDRIYLVRKLIIALLAIIVLVNLYRANFLDLLICFAFIALYQKNNINRNTVKFFFYSLGFSLFLELIWLYNFTSDWWNLNTVQEGVSENDYTNPYLQAGTLGLHQYTVVFSWISFFLKLSVLLSLYYLYNFMTSQESRQEPFKNAKYYKKEDEKYHDEVNQSQLPNIQIHDENDTQYQQNNYSIVTPVKQEQQSFTPYGQQQQQQQGGRVQQSSYYPQVQQQFAQPVVQQQQHTPVAQLYNI